MRQPAPPADACERRLADEVATARRRAWLEQNQEAFHAWNRYVAEHGVPLAAYRPF